MYFFAYISDGVCPDFTRSHRAWVAYRGLHIRYGVGGMEIKRHLSLHIWALTGNIGSLRDDGWLDGKGGQHRRMTKASMAGPVHDGCAFRYETRCRMTVPA